jgi:hypothetical protein
MNGSTDQPINRSTVHTLALMFWVLVLLLCSTSEVGSFVTHFYSHYLRPAMRGYGLSTHEAQKVLHVLLFGVLGWLLAHTHLPPRPAWLRGLVWSFSVGAVTELVQIVARGREPLISDAILNGTAGALTCWLVLRLGPSRLKYKQSRAR